jgi:hypothetical protein
LQGRQALGIHKGLRVPLDPRRVTSRVVCRHDHSVGRREGFGTQPLERRLQAIMRYAGDDGIIGAHGGAARFEQANDLERRAPRAGDRR